ncbi:MAG: GNAT family N-acetyltransferase [Actinomycetota bacterium]
MTLVIRPFTVDDADQFGLVHVRAWQATYRGTMTDEFLDALDGAAWARRWREHFADGDHGRVDLVAELDGHVVGAVSVGADRDETGLGELWAINIDPDVFGTGVGQELFTAGVEALRHLDFTRAVLWVVRENARARRFYERNGWQADGTEKTVAIGGTEVVELRYATRLRPPA